MNEEAQRVAIAEACGWTDIALAHDEADTDALNPVGLRNGRGCLHQRIPDYLNNLNAMHEAEKTLASREDCERFQNLLLLVKPSLVDATCAAERWTWHATAKQRAEAFLRTIGKWEDGK